MLQLAPTPRSTVTPELVLAYRDALAETRRLREGLPTQRPSASAETAETAETARVHADIRLHQVGRLATMVACVTAAGALFAATEVLTQWLRYGI